MKFAVGSDRGQVFVKDLPDFYDKILTTCKFALHKVDVDVKIFMIELFDDFCLDQVCLAFLGRQQNLSPGLEYLLW